MPDRIALITGTTGQDGAYLAELLLSKGYIVHGIKRRSSSFNTPRVDHLYQDPHGAGVKFFLHYGDMTDSTNLIRIIQEVQPTEIYNLAAQSHVRVSFETPEYTANADALGTLRLLEAIRILRLCQKTRFYQASTSELYGRAHATPQNEATPFYPRSPYAAAKLYAYWITINYREAYGMHASNGILFNHEGPTRAETFVTRAFAEIGIGIGWRGSGFDEQGFDKKSGRTLVEVDPRYFRPTEVDLLLGDPRKAFEKLGWKHTVTFAQLVSEMVASDLSVM